MRSQLVKLKSALSVGHHVARSFLPDRSFDHWTMIPTGPRITAHPFDIPLLVFSKVAANYACVAEIGAASGSRILAIKSEHPNILAYALDIRPGYTVSPVEFSGVMFCRHSDSMFESLPNGSLVVSVGTLTCFTPEDFRDFVALLRQRHMSLVFFEPVALVDIGQRSIRRRRATWFHPYSKIARLNGFAENIGASRWKSTVSSKFSERWHYDFWTPMGQNPIGSSG